MENEINWEITKWDDSVISGSDNLPKEIFVAKDNLTATDRPKQIMLSVYGKEYGVNLENGMFLKDGSWMEHPQAISGTPDHYRLIYFKRIRKLISEVQTHFEEICSVRNIYVGFQTTISGQNYKRMMVILPDGDVSWVSE